jgi:hypothetical protein
MRLSSQEGAKTGGTAVNIIVPDITVVVVPGTFYEKERENEDHIERRLF